MNNAYTQPVAPHKSKSQPEALHKSIAPVSNPVYNPFKAAAAAAMAELTSPEARNWYNCTIATLAQALVTVTVLALEQTARIVTAINDSIPPVSDGAPTQSLEPSLRHNGVLTSLEPSLEPILEPILEPSLEPTIHLHATSKTPALVPVPTLKSHLHATYKSHAALAPVTTLAPVTVPSEALDVVSSEVSSPTPLKSMTVFQLRAKADHAGVKWRGASRGKHLTKSQLISALSCL
jgi:hypothetical protein